MNPGTSDTDEEKSSSIKDQSPQFVPEDYSTESRQTDKENPYQEGSKEALLFDDMKEKGFNPYSPKDQDMYAKEHLAQQTGDQWKESKEAMNTISDHSREFSHRQKRNERSERKAALYEQLDQIEQEAMRRAEERQKKNSLLHRMGNDIRNRIWGEK